MSCDEIDRVGGAAGQAFRFVGDPVTVFDAPGAAADLRRNVGSMSLGGLMAPGPPQTRALGALGGAIAGGAYSAFTIGSHVRTVVPVVTIVELGGASSADLGSGGSEQE